MSLSLSPGIRYWMRQAAGRLWQLLRPILLALPLVSLLLLIPRTCGTKAFNQQADLHLCSARAPALEW